MKVSGEEIVKVSLEQVEKGLYGSQKAPPLQFLPCCFWRGVLRVLFNVTYTNII